MVIVLNDNEIEFLTIIGFSFNGDIVRADMFQQGRTLVYIMIN